MNRAPRPNQKIKKINAQAPVPAMRALYDSYFASRDYQRRYPAPNPATLAFLVTQGADVARAIIDVGCGDGRYALALLDRSNAKLTGCDISSVALKAFAVHLETRTDADRVQLVHGQIETLKPAPIHDMALLLFGVLSHAGDRRARVAMLQAIGRQTTPGARLLLTVPSIWRRRPWELLTSALRRPAKNQAGMPSTATWGDIEFTRTINAEPQHFFYHLYSISNLKTELAMAGWQLQTTEAESLLPEWVVTQHPLIGRLDALLRPLLPAALGYGIRAMALPMPDKAKNKTRTGL